MLSYTTCEHLSSQVDSFHSREANCFYIFSPPLGRLVSFPQRFFSPYLFTFSQGKVFVCTRIHKKSMNRNFIGTWLLAFRLASIVGEIKWRDLIRVTGLGIAETFWGLNLVNIGRTCWAPGKTVWGKMFVFAPIILSSCLVFHQSLYFYTPWDRQKPSFMFILTKEIRKKLERVLCVCVRSIIYLLYTVKIKWIK